MVRRPPDLDGLDALVLPGGESTTMGILATELGLLEPLRELIASGLPTFGTCAGMILLSREAVDGVREQPLLRIVDIVVRRNGYGSQVWSFEASVAVTGVEGGPVDGVFIRAPVIEKIGRDVEPLGWLEGDVVVARQGPHLVTAFHPELTDDLRLHRLFLESVQARGAG
jgi:pyridoxal 5'-phosphate synthase pdxT subunit